MNNKENVLDVERLSVMYGIVPAVSGASFAVQRGSISTIVGSNGAGKSTIMKALTGLVAPASGQVCFYGEDITGLAPDALVARGLVLVPEGRRLFKAMTVAENLELGAYREKDKMPSCGASRACWSAFPH